MFLLELSISETNVYVCCPEFLSKLLANDICTQSVTWQSGNNCSDHVAKMSLLENFCAFSKLKVSSAKLWCVSFQWNKQRNRHKDNRFTTHYYVIQLLRHDLDGIPETFLVALQGK